MYSPELTLLTLNYSYIHTNKGQHSFSCYYMPQTTDAVRACNSVEATTILASYFGAESETNTAYTMC
jgi:hypothetical protein